MMMPLELMRERIFPAVPPLIRDDFVRLTAARLQNQSRLLFLALLITVPAAIYAASSGASRFTRIGLPLIMGAACVLGFLSLLRDLKLDRSVRRSEKMIAQSTWVSSALAVVCSSWCVMSWLGAAEASRIYYPFILSMGSLATAYSLASVRTAAILNLAIGLLPIGTLMLLSGHRMDLAAGTSLMVAAAFLLRMVIQQHRQLVDMLLLQRQMRELADTDPLTGLVNRRALGKRLDHEIANAAPDTSFAFALLDLDGFKPVNDRYGHAIGDVLLCEVADRLRETCDGNAVVARMGGDEFAVFAPPRSALNDTALADRLLSVLIEPFAIAGHRIRVGASIGVARWPVDGATTSALYEAADHCLYAVKAVSHERRGQQTRFA